MNTQINQPSSAFLAASWVALLAGSISFLVGLWNSEMQLNEKGYYFTVLAFSLFSAISIQKTVRDRLEGIPVTGVYYGMTWAAMIISIMLLLIGLWNATLLLSEKGFFAMSFSMSLFAAISVQKNIRDTTQQEIHHVNLHDLS